MPRGRKPLPSVIKALNSNPGKRAANKQEPKPAAAVPECPPHITGEGRKEWDRITAELNSVGLISNLDRAALAAYAQAWGRWCEAEENLRKHGLIVKSPSGFPIQNPFLAVANRAMDQLTKLSSEFGLTPSSRSRCNTNKPAGGGTGIEDFIKA